MKGLFLNVPDARRMADAFAEQLGVPRHFESAQHPAFGRIFLDTHPVAWPKGPVFSDESRGLFAAGSGWIVFRGRLGDLEGFAGAFDADPVAAMAGVSGGAFLVLVASRSGAWIVTDPFGLHPHFTTDDRPFGKIAPSPHFFGEDRPLDAAMDRILRRTNQPFGNRTRYEGVKRLEPGTIFTKKERRSYFDYHGEPSDLAELPDVLAEHHRAFEGATKLLPLSGGLDSRLLLTAGKYDYAYTFGPRDTGDRPVAREFRERFRDYDEFSFLELEFPGSYREAGHQLFDGLCPRPFLELTAVYQRALRRWGDGCLFFDGYLGDVLLRGTYLTYPGARGAMAKLLPSMTLRNFDPLGVMRRRYPALSEVEFETVAEIFAEKTAGWDLDDLRKVQLFEILHGRGGRYAINGGTFLANQYFCPVQPFWSQEVYRRLFAADPEDCLRYRTMKRVWSRVSPDLADVPTYAGFKPTWHPDVARAVLLSTKVLARKRILKRAVSYDQELSEVRWS